MTTTTVIENEQQTVVQNVAYKGYSDGTVEFFGDQIESLTGYSREAFNQKTIKWTELIHAEDRMSVQESFKQALKKDKTYMRQYRIHAKSGESRWMQEWGQIVCEDSGKIQYVTGILVDITGQKHKEAERIRVQRRSGKYLIFHLGRVEYGVQIIRIKEIIGLQPITPVPRTPVFLKGVINLRGKVIPVIDLRQQFGLVDQAYSDRTCIIVVEADSTSGPLLIGTVVDAVSEVLQIRGEKIEDPPRFGTNVDTRYILGMAKTGQGVILLLDIDRVLQIEAFDAIRQIAPNIQH